MQTEFTFSSVVPSHCAQSNSFKEYLRKIRIGFRIVYNTILYEYGKEETVSDCIRLLQLLNYQIVC